MTSLWHRIHRHERTTVTAPATAVPGRLTVDKTTGKLHGNASLQYNDQLTDPKTGHHYPFPCINGTPHVTGAIRGVVMHTMVGNLPGTVTAFNTEGFDASSHFGIDQHGLIHQFGPIGKGWEAWAQKAGNLEWYSIEHADNGDPNNPLTEAQITASAQLVECLSAFAGFPLQVTDSTSGRGYGTHSMGGAAWGGHTCPDLPPQHVRSAQRQAIVDLAKQIRAATPGPFPSGRHVVDGTGTLAGLAKRQGVDVAEIIWTTAVELTAEDNVTSPGQLQRAYLNAGKWDERMPSGMILWLP